MDETNMKTDETKKMDSNLNQNDDVTDGYSDLVIEPHPLSFNCCFNRRWVSDIGTDFHPMDIQLCNKVNAMSCFFGLWGYLLLQCTLLGCCLLAMQNIFFLFLMGMLFFWLYKNRDDIFSLFDSCEMAVLKLMVYPMRKLVEIQAPLFRESGDGKLAFIRGCGRAHPLPPNAHPLMMIRQRHPMILIRRPKITCTDNTRRLNGDAVEGDSKYSKWQIFPTDPIRAAFREKDFRIKDFQYMDFQMYSELWKQANSICRRYFLIVYSFYLLTGWGYLLLVFRLLANSESKVFCFCQVVGFIIIVSLFKGGSDSLHDAFVGRPVKRLVERYRPLFLESCGGDLRFRRGWNEDPIIDLHCPQILTNNGGLQGDDRIETDTMMIDIPPPTPVFLNAFAPTDIDVWMLSDDKAASLMNIDSETWDIMYECHTQRGLEGVPEVEKSLVHWSTTAWMPLTLLSLWSHGSHSQTICILLYVVVFAQFGITFKFRHSSQSREYRSYEKAAKSMTERFQQKEDDKSHWRVDFLTSPLPGREAEYCARYQLVRCT